MSAPGLDQDYRSTWKALPRWERWEMARDASRGTRGASRRDAALMLWYARQQRRRWLRTALGQAGSFALGAAIVAVAISYLDPPADLEFFRAYLVVGFATSLLAHVATAVYRRPHLRRTEQLNAAMLAGHDFSGPPDPEEAERLLNLIRKEGWLRGMRAER